MLIASSSAACATYMCARGQFRVTRRVRSNKRREAPEKFLHGDVRMEGGERRQGEKDTQGLAFARERCGRGRRAGAGRRSKKCLLLSMVARRLLLCRVGGFLPFPRSEIWVSGNVLLPRNLYCSTSSRKNSVESLSPCTTYCTLEQKLDPG